MTTFKGAAAALMAAVINPIGDVLNHFDLGAPCMKFRYRLNQSRPPKVCLEK